LQVAASVAVCEALLTTELATNRPEWPGDAEPADELARRCGVTPIDSIADLNALPMSRRAPGNEPIVFLTETRWHRAWAPRKICAVLNLEREIDGS
jgi:hypothetical protein